MKRVATSQEPGARITQSALEAMCVKWQGKLRLLDWDVKIRFARGSELEDMEGSCSWSLNLKSATIKVLIPSDYASEGGWPQDIEVTVVHELLHLHIAPFRPEGKTKGILMEQAVDLIAAALVDCDRG